LLARGHAFGLDRTGRCAAYPYGAIRFPARARRSDPGRDGRRIRARRADRARGCGTRRLEAEADISFVMAFIPSLRGRDEALDSLSFMDYIPITLSRRGARS